MGRLRRDLLVREGVDRRTLPPEVDVVILVLLRRRHSGGLGHRRVRRFRSGTNTIELLLL